MQGQVGTELLSPLNWQELLSRLAVALMVGAIIGFERESRAKAAGLRTHILVSLSSALFVLIPIQLGMAQNFDALSRVFQGIITGIGFVGGGVILRGSTRKNTTQVSGLTTAVAIWLSCSLGIATGCGLWALGVSGAIFALLTLSVFKKLEKHS